MYLSQGSVFGLQGHLHLERRLLLLEGHSSLRLSLGVDHVLHVQFEVAQVDHLAEPDSDTQVETHRVEPEGVLGVVQVHLAVTLSPQVLLQFGTGSLFVDETVGIEGQECLEVFLRKNLEQLIRRESTYEETLGVRRGIDEQSDFEAADLEESVDLDGVQVLPGIPLFEPDDLLLPFPLLLLFVQYRLHLLLLHCLSYEDLHLYLISLPLQNPLPLLLFLPIELSLFFFFFTLKIIKVYLVIVI